jgi:hypothetical protein
MAIDPVSGSGSVPPPPTPGTTAGEPSAADVDQFNLAMDSPVDEATVRTTIEEAIRKSITDKIITDAFQFGKKVFDDGD